MSVSSLSGKSFVVQLTLNWQCDVIGWIQGIVFLRSYYVFLLQGEQKDSAYKWYAVIVGCLVMFLLLSLS